VKEYRPTNVGTVTKYVFVESVTITPEELALRGYEVSQGAMIKETCFGLQITGKPNEVKRIIEHIRELDPAHIFTKDRGFPPGDPRRCRANLGGARPGFHGHEFELPLLPYISFGLEKISEGRTEVKLTPVIERDGKKLDFLVLKKLMEAQEL